MEKRVCVCVRVVFRGVGSAPGALGREQDVWVLGSSPACLSFPILCRGQRWPQGWVGGVAAAAEELGLIGPI